MANAKTEARWLAGIREPSRRAEMFAATEYVCSAGDFEVHQLWERYHCYLGIAWLSVELGWSLQIGAVNRRPIMAGVTWAYLTERLHLVAFVYSPSELTDHAMLREWRGVVFPKSFEHRDAWNFAHLIHDMAKRDEAGNYFTRKPTLIDGVDESRDGVHPTLETVFPEMSLEDRFTFAERKMQAWGERARAYEAAMKAGYTK